MANTTFKELSDSVFNKIKDLDLASLSEDFAYDIVTGYIRPAIVKFENCKQDLSDRDDTLGEFNYELTDDTFVILVNYMIIEWLDSNFILTTNALKSRLSSSDFKSLNLSQQLGKAMELREMLLSENNQLAINKSYKKTDLFDKVKNRKKVY